MFDWMRDQLQDADIAAASRQISSVRTDVDGQLRVLTDRVDGLVLMNHALLSLLRDRMGITDEQVAARMHELDMSDGRADGRIATAPVGCGSCGRPLTPRRARCLYCGTARPGGPALPR